MILIIDLLVLLSSDGAILQQQKTQNSADGGETQCGQEEIYWYL